MKNSNARQSDLFKRPYFASVVFKDGSANKIVEYGQQEYGPLYASFVLKHNKNIAYVDLCERTANGPEILERHY